MHIKFLLVLASPWLLPRALAATDDFSNLHPQAMRTFGSPIQHDFQNVRADACGMCLGQCLDEKRAMIYFKIQAERGELTVVLDKPSAISPSDCLEFCTDAMLYLIDDYVADWYLPGMLRGGPAERYIKKKNPFFEMRDLFGVLAAVLGTARRNMQCWAEDNPRQAAIDPALQPRVPQQPDARGSPNAFSVREATEQSRPRWGTYVARRLRAQIASGLSRSGEAASLTRDDVIQPAEPSGQGPRPSMLKRVCLGVVGPRAKNKAEAERPCSLESLKLDEAFSGFVRSAWIPKPVSSWQRPAPRFAPVHR